MGFSPFELMLQLLAKKKIPSLEDALIIATRAAGIIPKPKSFTRAAPPACRPSQQQGCPGLTVLEQNNYPQLQKGASGELPVVVCSLGDNSVTEGEVSEALQFAALKQLPVIFSAG